MQDKIASPIGCTGKSKAFPGSQPSTYLASAHALINSREIAKIGEPIADLV